MDDARPAPRRTLRATLATTLPTTALAVCGLVAAAHLLHPGDDEAKPGRARVATAEAAPASAPWTDPPVRPRGAARLADAAAVLAPHLTMAPPPGALMAQPLPGALVPPAAGPARSAS